MESLKKEFWKHVATVGGPSDIEDIFLSWAADKKLAFAKAMPLWSSINKDVYAAFGQKLADVEVSFKGPDSEVAKALSNISQGGGEAGILEQAKEEATLPSEDVEKETLIDEINRPDKEETEIPPLTATPTETTPPVGGTPPIPPTAGAPSLPPTGIPPAPKV